MRTWLGSCAESFSRSDLHALSLPMPLPLGSQSWRGCRDNGLGFLGFRHCHLTLTFTLTLFTLALALAHVHATSHLEHGHSSASVKWHCSALSLRPDQECVHGIWRSKPRRFQSCSWSAARNNQALSSHPGDRTPARACKGRSLSGQQEERLFFFVARPPRAGEKGSSCVTTLCDNAQAFGNCGDTTAAEPLSGSVADLETQISLVRG